MMSGWGPTVGQWTLMMKVLQFHIWKKYHVMRVFFLSCNILKGLQSFRECFERKIGKSHKSTYFISWSMCQSSDSVGLFKFHQFTSFISVIIPCVIFNFLHFSWKNRWFSTISFQKITRFFLLVKSLPGMLIDLQGPWGNSLNDNW